MALRLHIVTPERPVVETDVASVVAPGEEGEFGVLEGHAPYLIALRPGVVRFESGGRTERVAISGGFAEVGGEHVTILARTAERRSEIDAERARAALARAEERLRGAGSQAPPEEIVVLQGEVARARARVECAAAG